MPKRLIPILSLMVVWIGLNHSVALAYEYLVQMTPNAYLHAHLQRADAVFAGRVIAANQAAQRIDHFEFDWRLPFIHLTADSDRYRSTFEVTKVWKGDVTARTSVIHSLDGCFNSYSFQQGEEYIVYAKWFDGELYIGSGSRTNLLSEAGEDLSAFGASKPPSPNTPLLADLPRRLALLSLFLGLFGWAAWELRRKYGVQKS